MKIIVTGGAGFIGLNFIKSLVNLKHKIVCIDYINNASNYNEIKKLHKLKKINFKKIDINDYLKIKKIIINFKPDIIVNFAAESHVDNSIKTPKLFFNSNVLGTLHLLEAIRFCINNSYIINNKFKLIHVSTDEVYGSLKFKENKSNEFSQYKPNSPYSASKASSDHIVRSYFKTYQIPSIITHCTNNYGPWQNREKFIPTIINSYLQNIKIPIYGNGKNIRDWIYVDDHNSAIRKIMKRGKIGEVYNISGKNQINNIKLVSMICSILNKKTSSNRNISNLMQFVDDRKGHDLRYDISSKKIERELDFFPKYTLYNGLNITIDWYIQNFKKNEFKKK